MLTKKEHTELCLILAESARIQANQLQESANIIIEFVAEINAGKVGTMPDFQAMGLAAKKRLWAVSLKPEIDANKIRLEKWFSNIRIG